ncbi:tripartite tricarboxylate transporter substrate binding protein [Belnapia sp. T6]|uniref:Tripartite tricarboxylate transporter substrate binding protein n=1 Tax=Belnapia mucosa TaxID=2804532 RepID=A0ABS1V1A6_9PROT|nr:tripartite tricarboxylate transporter substrate-binding protein [Belnapia mucosa]MBL6454073.1 tripartite tricarboxylate transporter substrate binding protein [Belnapia mucosa]
MQRAKILRGIGVAIISFWGMTVLATPTTAQTQGASFPERPITLVVGFSPGGSNDVTARVIAPELSRLFRVPVLVENRVGAAGTIATNYVAKSNPDGYTLVVTSASPLVLAPHTTDNIPYDTMRDLAGITLLGVTPEVLALSPRIAASNLGELVGLAQTRDVSLASAGSGGLPHLAIELFRSTAPGARILHVPYKGAAPAVTDALAGHVDGVVVDLPAVQAHIRAGRLRGLAVANERRSEFLPDIPTSGEQGRPAFIAVNWLALAAPARTPPLVLERLRGALVEVMQVRSVKDALAEAGVEVQLSQDRPEFQRFMAAEYEKWGGIARAANVRSTD